MKIAILAFVLATCVALCFTSPYSKVDVKMCKFIKYMLEYTISFSYTYMINIIV